MRKLFSIMIIVAACLFVGSCGNDAKKPIDQGEVAARAARLYYEHLLNGDYASFVAGMDQPDTIPDGYRKALEENAKEFMEHQEEEHKGIKGVAVARGSYNAKNNTADAYLIFSYGDKGSEQVVVPMVCRDSVWYMR